VGESASCSPDGQMFHRPGRKGGLLFLGTAAHSQTHLCEGLARGRDETGFLFTIPHIAFLSPIEGGKRVHRLLLAISSSL
jgi:hypothetical protein